jgi:SpoVK/Ycf46/Vps4 family AAA+-type ATPase
MSLNQMVSSQYQSTSSKRQRPLDPTELVATNDSNEFPTIEESKLGVDATSSSQPTSTAVMNDLSNPNGEAAIVTSASNKKKSGKAKTSVKSATAPLNDNVEDDVAAAILKNSRIGKLDEFRFPIPKSRLSDLAGIETITSQVKELVFYPVLYPELYSYLGVRPPCGLLLHGPSGCGKTALAHAIAGELGLPFFKASGPELVGGTSGESEERIRGIFEAAAASSPSVLFIDALDVIAAKKDGAQRGMDRRIIAQLFDSIDTIISLGDIIAERDDGGESKEGNMNKGLDTKEVDEEGCIPAIFRNKPEPAAAAPAEKSKLVVLIAATNKYVCNSTSYESLLIILTKPTAQHLFCFFLFHYNLLNTN